MRLGRPQKRHTTFAASAAAAAQSSAALLSRWTTVGRRCHVGPVKHGPEAPQHGVTITEFGAVGDGVTLNTKAFQNAIFYLNSFADKGGAQLFVPAGRWLTGSFSLISHLTLSLDKDAVIIGSPDSFHWPVIDPLPSYGRDSSRNVCIDHCYVTTGDDVIVIKSGWDEYGISFAHPSSNISISNITGETQGGAGIAFGSEMSGGISEVRAEGLHIVNSLHGIRIKTTPGRGGYVKNVYIADVSMDNVSMAIRITGNYGEHPDDRYDRKALPMISNITIKDVVGINIGVAGSKVLAKGLASWNELC
ncbi:hypothetical protein PR202_gb10384 [Eleusine coracana subsp. coracana]|uniref:Polygalacturonase n=1 Tax=Eleusine coracana subsp. coracana TaxID=191504 RepID=A0AAV5EKT2_ELECO|nr:hypothetical protein PR202_gb10384 [Eleusine coracana subsp. coracana]